MVESVILEPAISEHLRVERTLPSNLPKDYEPPFPAYSPRFPKHAQDLVMAVIGMQLSEAHEDAKTHREKLLSFIRGQSENLGPQYWELASVVDKAGYLNESVIAYWQTRSDFDSWARKSGFSSWWQDLKPDSSVGWFQEVTFPSVDRFETVFSNNNASEGAAHMRESVSGPLQEHVYWGSMRDRLPISQTDRLVGETPTQANNISKLDTRTRRIKAPARENLAIIRSGQDWSDTTPHERKLYVETMHPVLIKGMDFLRDQGSDVGCFDNRFMTVCNVSNPSQATDKTFGLAYFDDLASLEVWAKKHQTHLDIFGRFLQYAGELQGNVSLRLFHEVMVLKPEQQMFEYIGCHRQTGLLAAL